MLLLLIAAILTGSVVPIQTAANSQLRYRLNSPFMASITNSSIGVIFLILFSLCLWQMPQISKETFINNPWWLWTGGILGAFIICSAVLVMPVLGSLRTVLITMLGSISCGLIVDHFGLFNVVEHKFDLARLAGIVMVLFGLCFVLKIWVLLPFGRSKVNQENTKQSGTNGQVIPQYSPLRVFFTYILAFVAGCVVTIQTAVNSILSYEIHSAIHTALITMSETTLIFALVIMLRREQISKLRTIQIKKSAWILCGGFCGATFIIGNSYLLPHLGASALVVLNIVGQLTSSMIIDQFGLMGAEKKKTSIIQIVGLIIIIAGVVALKKLTL